MDEETELHRELLTRLDEIDRRALDAVERVELPEYERQVALGLFVAAWEVFKGIRALVERRLAEEALMLSRTLLEDTAKLMWLARDPSERERRAIQYGLTSAKYAKDVATTARANGWAWADEMIKERAKEIAALRGAAKAAGLGDEPDPFPKTWELLIELKQERLAYWFARASQSVHSTVIGVSARIEPAEREGESNQIRMQSPLEETARVGIASGELTDPSSCFAVQDLSTVFNFAPFPGAPGGVYDAYVKQSVFPGCFANGLPASEGAVLAATQRPLATSALADQSGVPAWATIASWAVVGTEDHVIPEADQLRMAQDAGADITKVDAPHLSMISDPDVVTRVITKAA